MLDDNERLSKEVEDLRERAAKSGNAENLKKQADQNYKQYLELAEKYADLERKVGKDGTGRSGAGDYGSSSGRDEYELKSRSGGSFKDD